jgi:hypothetical protein
MRPDADDPHHHAPNAGEAVGVWILGMLWALACLWLGYLGGHWVLPGVLVVGLLAMWGWNHIEWLWWFPAVLVISTILEPHAPLPTHGRFGPLDYVDLLTLGVTLVAVVRSVGLRRPLLPRTPIDGLIGATVVLTGLSFALPGGGEHALADLKHLLVRLVVFYATTTVASRPLGSRWVWMAFPLAGALIGCQALWTTAQGTGALSAEVLRSDQVWGSHNGLFDTLLVAAPMTAGLAFTAGDRRARIAWMVAGWVALMGIVFFVVETQVMSEVFTRAPHWTPIEIVSATLACVTLLTLARLAWEVRAGRQREGPRWLGVTMTFVMLALIEWFAPALSGPAIPLRSVAAGLVIGTIRADRRARRSGREIAPALEKAA